MRENIFTHISAQESAQASVQESVGTSTATTGKNYQTAQSAVAIEMRAESHKQSAAQSAAKTSNQNIALNDSSVTDSAISGEGGNTHRPASGLNSGKHLTGLTRLASLILATLLLAACGGGGGGGGSSGGGGGGGGGTTPIPVPDLATSLNSAQDGIVLSWTNPADVRNLTLTRIDYPTATSASTNISTVIHSNVTGNPALIAAGRITLNITETTLNQYYSFNITRGYDGGLTDTIVSARQYLPPTFVSVVTATLTADKTGANLSWSNPQNAAGITTVRITRQAYLTATGAADGTPVITTTTDASAIASSTSVESAATFALPALTANLYYEFTVTPIYTGTGAVAGLASAATAPRLYIPPATGAVTATLSTDGTAVELGWTNPTNVLGITSIRISRQAYLTATGAADGAAVITTTTDTTAIASSTTQTTAASLTIPALTANLYYTFTVTPTYAGNIVGIETTPSNRQYLPPAIAGTVTASLNADKTSVALSWSNPANVAEIASISITRQAYLAQTGATVGGLVIVPNSNIVGTTTASSTTEATSINVDITGLPIDRYYTFTVTPVYTGNGNQGLAGPASVASTPRVYIPPAISGVSATLNADNTIVQVSWTNPENTVGIAAIRITSQGYDAATGGATDGAAVSMLYTDSSDRIPGAISRQLGIGLNGIEAGKHYEFTITPIYTGSIEGLVSAATSPRVELMPAAGVDNLNILRTFATGLSLSWTNPTSFKSIEITRNSYASIDNSDTTIVDTASLVHTTTEIIMQGDVAVNLVGLDANQFHSFTVIPTYNNGILGTPATTPTRVGLVRDADIDADTLDVFMDADDNGLIDINNPFQLNRIRNFIVTGAGTNLTTDTVDTTGCGATGCMGYELLADLDFNDLEPEPTRGNWIPLGFCTANNVNPLNGRIISDDICGANAFSGNFDGNNNTINNMRIINPPRPNGVGLFGSTDFSDLRNIIMGNSSISLSSGRHIGGLVGYAKDTNVTRALAGLDEILPMGESVAVGGLLGGSTRSIIISSAALTNLITGRQFIGGLVGQAFLELKILASVAVVNNIVNVAVQSTNSLGGLVGGVGSSNFQSVFSAAITSSLGHGGSNNVGGLVGNINTLNSKLINASYVLSNSISGDVTANVGGILGPGNSVPVESSYYNVTSFSRTPNTRGTELNAVGDQPSLQPSSFSNIGDADFTSWGQGWCDKTTGEFTQDPASALALSNGGANYAWDIGAGKFPVPACTPFSPETLRTAIDKVRNNENPVPIN